MTNELPPKKKVILAVNSLLIYVPLMGFMLDGNVHCHIEFSDERNGFGGHLEEGTKALTFANIAIGELEEGVKIAGWDKIADEKNLVG